MFNILYVPYLISDDRQLIAERTDEASGKRDNDI